MKTILMCYLIIFRGYSVMRVHNSRIERDVWGACNDVLEYDFGHNGEWAEGNTPQEAVFMCWEKAKKFART